MNTIACAVQYGSIMAKYSENRNADAGLANQSQQNGQTQMAITNFDFPGVTLRQVFAETSASGTSTLSVACVGRCMKLHRAEVASEAALIATSANYTAANGLAAVALPGRDLSAELDTDTGTQRLIVKNGQFSYYTTASGVAAIQASSVGTNLINFTAPVANGGGFSADPVNFGTRGAKVGDTVILTGTMVGGSVTVMTEIIAINFIDGVGYAQIQVASLGDLDNTATAQTATFCAAEDTSYEPGADTFTISAAGTITISRGLTVSTIDGLSGITCTLQKADFYVEYREKTFDYVGQLGAVSGIADVEEVLGGVTPENPLAMAVYFAAAAANGTVVYFTGVRDDTPANYIEALDFLEKYPDVYSIVPATEDKDIIKACLTSVLNASENEESKIRRTLWYGATQDASLLLAAGNATAVAATGKITFADSVFVAHPFKAGDVAVRKSTGDVFQITSTDGISIATVSPAPSADIAVAEAFELIRMNPSNEDRVSDIIAKRYTNSYRAQCVWADDVMFNGDLIDNYAIAAAAAGMRSYEPCQRPLSNLPYAFFDVAETHGFTKSQLKQLGANGIWIIANNNDGTPINMRQITTAMKNNINLDEESIISNADDIAMELSHIGENLVGCSNISQMLIFALSDTISG